MYLKETQHIYFIGIGGIGMSAIARYLMMNNKCVAGFDKVETEITKALEIEGADIHFIDSLA